LHALVDQERTVLSFDADKHIAFCVGGDLFDRAAERCAAVLTLAEGAEND